MAAPKGNQYWKNVNFKTGRKSAFETPEEMWDLAVEYFEDNSESVIEEERLFHYQGMVTRKMASHVAPMSIRAFCLFANMAESTFYRYAATEEFKEVTQAIKDVMNQQKFDGAAVGLYRENIIARELGLADKTDHTSSDGTMSPTSEKDMTDEELIEELAKNGIKPEDIPAITGSKD